jgi:hypothetical protein
MRLRPAAPSLVGRGTPPASLSNPIGRKGREEYRKRQRTRKTQGKRAREKEREREGGVRRWGERERERERVDYL